MCSSSQEPSAPVKLAALFAFGNEEPGDQFKSSVFRNADPSNVEGLFLREIKIICSVKQYLNFERQEHQVGSDHFLSQAKSELQRQEHQVGSLNI